MKWRAVLLLSFLAMLAASANFAQEKAGQGEPVLRVETRLVQISVVAQDSSGRAVTGLSREDFSLYDDGKPVPIDLFSAASLQRAPAATLPPNTFSNRGAPPIITVVLLDGLNTSFQDQSWARTQVVRFLEELRPEDRVGIMLLGEHLYVLQNFTSDPQLLLAALRHAPIRNPREVGGSAPPQSNWDEADQASVNVMGSPVPSSVDPATTVSVNPSIPSSGASAASGAAAGPAAGFAGEAAAMAQMEAIMNQFQGHQSAFFGTDRVQRTLEALSAIANYLGQFPGRKNLIWVSSSFPVSVGFVGTRQPGDTRDQIHFAADFERAYKTLNSALNKANLAIYPVDPRGLVAAAPGTSDWNDLYSTQGTMKELASATGGQAFVNTNDLARAMRAAADDSLASYELGFYAHDVRWNGQYHALKVKVSRPGVHLRYRQGYFATKEPKKTGDQNQIDTQFDQALYSPLDSPGLGLRVTLEKVTHKTDTRRVMGTDKVVPYHKDRALLGINVDAHDIALPGGSGGGSVQLALVLAQTGADGKVLDAARYDMKMRVAAGGAQRLAGEGLRMEKWVDLVQGATSLELVVRDPGSGVLGSVRIPVGGA
ncbi:MAG TPA: VWA domain-containing protein [Terriglobia bacterium]|nr:VWA domain-containing protein [Terriglobia bacterium]